MANLSTNEDLGALNASIDSLPSPTAPAPPNANIKASNLSQSAFLRLPAEIRLKIYSFSLINPSPIIVWSAYPPRGYPQPTHKVDWNRDRMASGTRDLAFGLLRCSTVVAAESAQVFYYNNTFRFEGEHEFYPVITWLDKLNNNNREYLHNLEITIPRPQRAWQFPDGSRRKMVYTQTRGLASHHPYFAPRIGPYEEGEVDIVDPAIETIISLLSKCKEWEDHRKITLVFDTGYYNIPGIELYEEEDTSLFSLDLPNMVDIWRGKYFSDTNQGVLEIFWRAAIMRDNFSEKRHLIEGVGWKILKIHEGEHRYHSWGRPGFDTVVPTMQLLMKRDVVALPIMAGGPSPYTSWHERPVDS
ncbi:MAG: hypothetical protein LQ337_005469 [Flavoplaca oasis]|nr:MAG: hypothetical protein LQ337_005469 [Flavoplaca oasis]